MLGVEDDDDTTFVTSVIAAFVMDDFARTLHGLGGDMNGVVVPFFPFLKDAVCEESSRFR